MALVSRRLSAVSAVVAALLVSAAQAGAATATYVSVRGRDTNPCTQLLPCRTFATAFGFTDAGGTVVAIDSGIFATDHLNLTRSVTIAAAPGVHAVLRPATFAAVSINAGATAVVTLRGLTMIAPLGAVPPFNGIVYNSAAELNVEDCEITGFPTKGMLVLSSGRLVVSRTVVRSGVVGISLDGHVRAAFDDVTITDAEFGLMSSLGASATIRGSLITGNGVGLLADAAVEQHTAELSVEDCLITHNTTGLESRYSRLTVARLSRSTITNNTTGVLVDGGVVETRSNNLIRGNTTDISGALIPIAGE